MKLCKHIEILYNENGLWEAFGFIHYWKWKQADRIGYSFAIANLVFIFGETNPNLPFIDFDE
jgi:hypothetical protein